MAYVEQPSNQGSGLKPLWITLGCGGLLALVVCGGAIGLFVYFAKQVATAIEEGGGAIVDGIFDELAKQVQADLKDNPVMAEKIGEIESFELDLAASSDLEDDEVFVYNIKGKNGSGVLTVKHVTDSADTEKVIWAKLKLENGEEVDVVKEKQE